MTTLNYKSYMGNVIPQIIKPPVVSPQSTTAPYLKTTYTGGGAGSKAPSVRSSTTGNIISENFTPAQMAQPTVNSPSSTSPVTDLYGSPYQSPRAGLRRVAQVFNPFNLGTIYLSNPKTGAPIADVTLPVKLATIGGEVLGAGAIVGALGATTAGGATAGSLTATGAAGKISPFLIGAGAGIVTASLLNGKGGTQTTTPTQTTSPIQTPTQTITPQQQIAQGSGGVTGNPEISQSGSGSIIQTTNTSNLTYNLSNPVQYTTSYQINEQITTSTQSTTTEQSTGIDPLMIAILAGVILLAK